MIVLRNVSKIFNGGSAPVTAVDNVSLQRGLRANRVKNHVNDLTYCFLYK
ncbi:uncharacterized protein EpC_pEp360350 (plasmid) [Erwinia pyrifoliae Ep1/96]|nr:uncharacterized protein EpC_pEp360350 [Erwinia pyrifoliae Ep1/96]